MEEKKVKLTITIPEQLRREARGLAILKGTTITTLIRDLLTAYVKENKPQELET